MNQQVSRPDARIDILNEPLVMRINVLKGPVTQGDDIPVAEMSVTREPHIVELQKESGHFAGIESKHD
jgi:hypothetical protein